MKLIVGLGNFEPRYASTRHNAGFWVVDALATEYGVTFEKSKHRGLITKVHCPQGAVLLAKPTTYMNASGECVQALMNFYKLELHDLLVIHDDVALPLGRLRVQSGGGAGGQHGIEDIIYMLGEQKNFDRIKFGVGPDPGGDRRADYVLSPVPPGDVDMRDKMIKIAADAAKLWLMHGAKEAANKFNGIDLRPPKPASPPPPPAIEQPAPTDEIAPA